MAQMAFSELAEDMMTRVRKTCGTENAKRVRDAAQDQAQTNASVSNFVMTRDIVVVLDKLKLTAKFNGGKPFVEPVAKSADTATARPKFVPIKAKQTAPRRVRRFKD